VNARFVPLYFDLGRGSPAGDAAAKKVIAAIDPRLAGQRVPTPDVFILDPDGKLIDRTSNYASEAKYLALLRKVVGASKALSAETEAEAKRSIAERSWLRYCIGDTEAAMKLVAAEKDSLARARILRWERKFEDARKALGKHVDSFAERGVLEVFAAKYAEASALLTKVGAKDPRHAEAQYFLGVARFQQGKTKDAQGVWNGVIKTYGENAWSYRSDWALQNSKAKPGGGPVRFTTTGKKSGRNSGLGRHGYMGRKNPDLLRRS